MATDLRLTQLTRLVMSAFWGVGLSEPSPLQTSPFLMVNGQHFMHHQEVSSEPCHTYPLPLELRSVAFSRPGSVAPSWSPSDRFLPQSLRNSLPLSYDPLPICNCGTFQVPQKTKTCLLSHPKICT